MNGNALAILCLTLGMAGCASPTPMLDDSFGNAARVVPFCWTKEKYRGGN